VAPPGVEISEGEGESARADTSPQCSMPAAPYVLFLGRLDPIKQLEALIDAFIATTSVAELNHWHLVIGGDGRPAYKARLKKRAGACGNGKRVHFCGWLSGSAKFKALSGAALFALTSSHENFGRAAVEAMMAGIPVVVSEEVFLSDLIRSSGSGWVAGQEQGGLSHVLGEAMLSAECRASKGLAARRIATRQFGVRDTSSTVVERYRSIIEARGGLC
jgi:glycosyltransferase involved in cell wall biosynthesis